jgi:hypothetical protein
MLLRRIAMGLAGLLLLLFQLVPQDRSNPPVRLEIQAPGEIHEILRRSCYDCHSNETRWPWYAWVAPVSWLVVHDVHEGRDEMNFSEWDRYDPEERVDKLEEAWEEVEEGEMPMFPYTVLHPSARLSEAELRAFEAWVEGATEK